MAVPSRGSPAGVWDPLHIFTVENPIRSLADIFSGGDHVCVSEKRSRELSGNSGAAHGAHGRAALDGSGLGPGTVIGLGLPDSARRSGRPARTLCGFEGERQIPEEELWQFRFLRDEPSTNYLPVVAKLREVHHETDYGRWSTALGEDPAGLVYIERLIEVGESTLCLSRMYLPAGRFGSIMTGHLIEMNSINIKLLLRNEFGAHTNSTHQIIRFVRLSREQAGLFDQDEDCTAIQPEATGLDQNTLPITYHEVVIPPSDVILDVTFFWNAPQGQSDISCHCVL